MKFLCIPCDRPMTLRKVTPPERGSVSLVYSCPECGYGMAMLTNPHETQVVTSLGVEIGPGGEEVAAASKCPFTGMLQDAEADSDAQLVAADGNESPAAATESGPAWSEAARSRLEAIPETVRAMAKMGIEQYARDQGHQTIGEEVLEEARRSFGF